MNNYEPWGVELSEFPKNGTSDDKLKFFARLALLAPSGHNSQPWLLKAGAHKLEVHINRDHFISGESGLLTVEPYVSIGCFIETLHLAAGSFGYEIKQEDVYDGDHIANLAISTKQHSPDSDLARAIKARVSNRSKFSREKIPKKVLKELLDFRYEGVEATLLESKPDLDWVAKQTETALRRIMSKKKYRTELAEWVRNNATKKHDGMPGFTHGVPSIPSFFAKPMIKNSSKLGPPPKKSADLIRNSGALLMVGLAGDAEENKIAHTNLGRAYARFSIVAEMRSYSSSALGAAVIDPEIRQVVIRHFSLDYKPIVIIRVGKKLKNARHTPRYNLEAILE